MKGVRMSFAAAALGLVLAGCAGGGQVGAVQSDQNPPAEPAQASTQSPAAVADERAQEKADDPRTEVEKRRDAARDAAKQVKKFADDVTQTFAESHFTMPRLIGRNLQDAQDLLQARGSYLLDQVDATDQHRFQLLDSNWKVCAQSPRAGSHPLKTKLVRLEAVKSGERCP